jgi:hypothetical protein
VRAVTNPDKRDAQRLIEQASALQIPWARILEDEIRAERALRLCLADVDDEWPLWPTFWILPFSLLNSWRVRQRIQGMAWKATHERCEASARQLRDLAAHLLGRRNGWSSEATILARHLWFGYQRVLTLSRVCRVAERMRVTGGDAIELIRTKADCSTVDARWALERARSPMRGHRLDDVMRRVRSEGFELPEDRSEVCAFRRLRSFVRSSPHPKGIAAASGP